jgi:hypothetical protein
MSRSRRLQPLLCAMGAALLLAGCNASAPSPQASAPAPSSAPAGVTPSSFRMPDGAGCSGDIARWKAIQDNDLATGHVSKSVYDGIQNDINQASAACAGGRDAEARALVRASRVRNGYPAS